MTTAFPGALDTFTNPNAATDYLNTGAVLHDAQHANANDAVEAIEAKIGTGASTPIVNRLLRGTGTGTSAWAQVAAGDYAAGSIVNADVNSAAAIAATKMASYAFLAYNSADDASATGAGAQATVDFDTELFDLGSAFASDTFTAPVTGKFRLSAGVQIGALTAAMTQGILRIVTSNRTYLTQFNIGAARTPGAEAGMQLSVLADMDAADTATVTLQIANGAGNDATIQGAATPATFFSGHQVG